jgi:hypothetical protein
MRSHELLPAANKAETRAKAPRRRGLAWTSRALRLCASICLAEDIVHALLIFRRTIKMSRARERKGGPLRLTTPGGAETRCAKSQGQ